MPAPASRRYHAGVRAPALDLGLRRIGLAISDPSATLARPLEVIEPRRRAARARRRRRSAAWPPRTTGRSVSWSGCRSGSTERRTTDGVSRAFASAWRAVSQPVVLQDERLSSVEAESRLAVRDRDWRSRKKKLDAAARR